jgi:hypothetical protein
MKPIIRLAIAGMVLALLSCNPGPKKAAEAIPAITCDSGYSIIARYSVPDSAGILSRLDLTITKDGKAEKLVMFPAISASGSKFATSDQKQVFWEHQDEFYYFINDTLVCTCKKSKK